MVEPSNCNKSAQRLGSRYEALALDHLKHHGLGHLQSNYRVSGGEIDLIMQEQDILVFVEVRYRHSNSWESSAQSISYPKQKRIIRAAQQFIQRHTKHQRQQCRFDAICFDQQNKADWIRDAFRVQ